jgi:hypothetical protein
VFQDDPGRPNNFLGGPLVNPSFNANDDYNGGLDAKLLIKFNIDRLSPLPTSFPPVHHGRRCRTSDAPRYSAASLFRFDRK